MLQKYSSLCGRQFKTKTALCLLDSTDPSVSNNKYEILCSLLTRYLEIVHSIWHKTHFKKKWLYMSFAIIWPFGMFFNGAVWIPTTKVSIWNIRPPVISGHDANLHCAQQQPSYYRMAIFHLSTKTTLEK